MGRAPCCDKANVRKGPWSPEEDSKLLSYILEYGTGGNWIALPKKAGLNRCGKSCRLRWVNYLRPNIEHRKFTDEKFILPVTIARKGYTLATLRPEMMQISAFRISLPSRFRNLMNQGREHSAAPLEGSADDNQAPLARYSAGSQVLRKLMFSRGANTNNMVSSRQSSLDDHFSIQISDYHHQSAGSIDSSLFQSHNVTYYDENGVLVPYSDESLSSDPESDTRVIPSLCHGTGLAETFLMMIAETASILWTASNDGNSLSCNARILSDFSTACNIMGFLCFMYNIFLFGRKHGIVARSIRGIGYVVTAFGFLAVMAMRLHDNLNLWITAAACIAALPALARTFVK